MSKITLRFFLCVFVFSLTLSYVAAAEKTFTPLMDYKGDMYVVIKVVGYAGYEECSEIKVVWGPWETEPLSAIRSARSGKPLAIMFEKKKRDQVPLTVIANCSTSIELMTGKPDRGKYEVIKPNWRRR